MQSEGSTYRLRGERRSHASAPDREESRVSVRVTHWLGGLPAPTPPPPATTPPRKQARGPITDDNKRERLMPACVWCRLYGVRSSSVEAPLSPAAVVVSGGIWLLNTPHRRGRDNRRATAPAPRISSPAARLPIRIMPHVSASQPSPVASCTLQIHCFSRKLTDKREIALKLTSL